MSSSRHHARRFIRLFHCASSCVPWSSPVVITPCRRRHHRHAALLRQRLLARQRHVIPAFLPPSRLPPGACLRRGFSAARRQRRLPSSIRVLFAITFYPVSSPPAPLLFSGAKPWLPPREGYYYCVVLSFLFCAAYRRCRQRAFTPPSERVERERAVGALPARYAAPCATPSDPRHATPLPHLFFRIIIYCRIACHALFYIIYFIIIIIASSRSSPVRPPHRLLTPRHSTKTLDIYYEKKLFDDDDF